MAKLCELAVLINIKIFTETKTVNEKCTANNLHEWKFY